VFDVFRGEKSSKHWKNEGGRDRRACRDFNLWTRAVFASVKLFFTQEDGAGGEPGEAVVELQQLLVILGTD